VRTRLLQVAGNHRCAIGTSNDESGDGLCACPSGSRRLATLVVTECIKQLRIERRQEKGKPVVVIGFAEEFVLL
jgi:hypothetical protein